MPFSPALFSIQHSSFRILQKTLALPSPRVPGEGKRGRGRRKDAHAIRHDKECPPVLRPHPPRVPLAGGRRLRRPGAHGAARPGRLLRAARVGRGAAPPAAHAAGPQASALRRPRPSASSSCSCTAARRRWTLFDYKPELQKRDGQSIEIEIRRGTHPEADAAGLQAQVQAVRPVGPVVLRRFPHIAQHMDKLAIIKSLYADTFAHGSAMIQMNSGRIIQGHPVASAPG